MECWLYEMCVYDHHRQPTRWLTHFSREFLCLYADFREKVSKLMVERTLKQATRFIQANETKCFASAFFYFFSALLDNLWLR